MESQKQTIINELALKIGKIIDSSLKHITDIQKILKDIKDIKDINDIKEIYRLEKMLKKEERYLKNKSREKDSLVLLTLVTMDEDRYKDTKQKLENMFQDIETHVIQFFKVFEPQFETLYSILRKSPRGIIRKNAFSSSIGCYVLLALTFFVI